MSGYIPPPRDGRNQLPPRPAPPRDNDRPRYHDRDAHRHEERHYRDRDDYRHGGRGRNWDEPDERDYKRQRYEDERPPRRYPPPPRDDYPPPSHRDDFSHYPPREEYHHPDHDYRNQAHVDESYGASPGPAVHGGGGGHPFGGPRKPPVNREPPSASVVLLGLPAHVGDAHLRHFLEDMGASIDSTTVIMDRSLGISKRYGFAKFSSVEHARAFVEPNFPSVPWKERGVAGPDDGMRIKINYSQKSGGWSEAHGATARLTDDQRRATEGSTSQGFYMNDGTRDIGSTPTQILLLRGLDALSNEEEVVAALSRVGGRASGEVLRGGVKKVMIARDRGSRQSWGFAFVQFSDVKLATDVLASAFNATLHPAGFRIRNRIIALSFTHENSFIPIYAKSEWSFKGEGNQQLAYWDDKAFVQPWFPPKPNPSQVDNIPRGPKADEDAKMDKDMMAFLGGLDEEFPELDDGSKESSTAPPVVIPPPRAIAAVAAPAALPAPGSIAPISIKPIASAVAASIAAPPSSTTSSAPTNDALPGGGIVPAPPLGMKEKKSDLIISRKAAPNIAKWNVKQKELKVAAPPPAGTAPAAASTSSTAVNTATTSTSKTTSASSNATVDQQQQPLPSPVPAGVSFDDAEFEHGDPISMICLLCQRQFKKIEELRKHNKLSALHKTNLEKAEVVTACQQRKNAARKKHSIASPAPTTSTDDDTSKPKYVDRAAQRRLTFNQSGKPEPPVPSRGGGKKKFEGPEPLPKPVPIEAAPNKDGLEETNQGMKMLEKMGWSKGAGLGASGAGRVDPIQAAQFAQGAGLGSTKGIAVGSEDTSLTYAEKLREKARARLNKS